MDDIKSKVESLGEILSIVERLNTISSDCKNTGIISVDGYNPCEIHMRHDIFVDIFPKHKTAYRGGLYCPHELSVTINGCKIFCIK